MKYRFTFFLFFYAVACVLAQPINLVPNGGFEERDLCIYNDSYINDCHPWFNPGNHGNGLILGGTPDLFHACAVVNEEPCPYPDGPFLGAWLFGVPTNTLGCEEPYEGKGYAGAFFFIPNSFTALDGFREYLAVRLIQPLEKGTLYHVSMQLSLAERTTHAIWNVQVLFSEDSLLQPTTEYMPYEPQLQGTPGEYIDNYDGWQEIAWEYTATGGEAFMYIGNFEPDSQIDTLRTLEGDTFLHYFPASYYFVDDVKVVQSTLGTNSRWRPHVNLYPNPCHELLTIDGLTDDLTLLEVHNAQGRLIPLKYNSIGRKIRLDTSSLAPDVYILTLYFKGNFTKHKFVKRYE